MLRTLDLIMISAMIAAAAFTYQVKHEAEDKLEQVRKLQAAIRLQEATIDLLEADWSLLNQPSRLQSLSTAYEAELKLKPMAPSQMAGKDELPGAASEFAPVVADDATGQPDADIKTGSVAQ
ncbi:hypothetical protein DFR52_104549 [Hoeflea marina]|uniref:Cell division protein FtsL n=1 Tax=Hoeflea marina TaxID=274592 RepID=A0A317PH39_9HYPH|nr:hypothetical protein [Hoeflea marina]PWV99256.1 hypothetical protein DFR52_104549 [Hoeflea marina]